MVEWRVSQNLEVRFFFILKRKLFLFLAGKRIIEKKIFTPDLQFFWLRWISHLEYDKVEVLTVQSITWKGLKKWSCEDVKRKCFAFVCLLPGTSTKLVVLLCWICHEDLTINHPFNSYELTQQQCCSTINQPYHSTFLFHLFF